MDESLRAKLGIKPGQKVSLFHPRKDLLGEFMKGDLQILVDWAEEDCDAILFWLQPKDDVRGIFPYLVPLIKARGRIWLVLPKKEDAVARGYKHSWEDVHHLALAHANLVANRMIALGADEYGTQFVKRKEPVG